MPIAKLGWPSEASVIDAALSVRSTHGKGALEEASRRLEIWTAMGVRRSAGLWRSVGVHLDQLQSSAAASRQLGRLELRNPTRSNAAV